MRRDAKSLLFATALHAVVLLGLHSERARPRIDFAPGPKDLELEIDLRTGPEARVSIAPLPVVPKTDGDVATRGVVAATSAKRAAGGGTGEREIASPLEPPEPAVTSPNHDKLFQETPASRVNLALMGGGEELNPFLVPRSSRHEDGALGTDGSDDRSAERAVRNALHERDQKLGIGVSGPRRGGGEDFARTSTAWPSRSHAVFEVVADREGKVSCRSRSRSSERRRPRAGNWDAIATGILAALRTKRLHVPRHSLGMAMTIAIESREALPSGTSPGVNMTLLDQKVKSGKNDRSAQVSIFPLVHIPLTLSVPGRPGTTQEKSIVLPIPTPSISGIFDVSDFGAIAVRVVHAHVTSEREL